MNPPEVKTPTDSLDKALEDFKAKSNSIVETLNDLAVKGKLYKLLPEEVDLLKEFRKFKTKLTKPKVFTYFTRPLELPNDIRDKTP